MIKPEGCTGLFRVSTQGMDTTIYAVIGMHVMYYDPDFDEWVDSVMNSIELEELSSFGVASVEKIE